MTAENLDRKKREKAIVKRLEYVNAEIKARKRLNDYCSDNIRGLNEERRKLREELKNLKTKEVNR